MSDLFLYLNETFIFKDLYKIKWTKIGEGPPVILTHGTPFSSLEWLPYAKALQKHYCVYLWDLAGFGASQEVVTTPVNADDPDVSYALQGELFAALCSFWGFTEHERPHVIAHDIGGHTVLRAHVLHGVKYASLCLLDPVAVNPWGSAFLRLVRDNAHVFEQVPPAIFEGMLREYVQSAAHKRLNQDEMDEFVRPWLDRGSEGQKSFIRQMKCASPKHTEEQEYLYAKVMESEEGAPKKLKIIWAENDSWIPIERGEKLQQLTRAPEFVRVEKAGHLVLVDQPELVMYEIAAWLAKIASS